MCSNSDVVGNDSQNPQERYAPGSVEDRLLKLDADSSKKALHDSRSMKRLGVVFIVFGFIILLVVEPLLLVLPRIPGFSTFKDNAPVWALVLLPLVVILPSYGVVLRHCRSTAAQWLIRIVSILMIIEGVFSMIKGVRTSNYGEFAGALVSVLISIRLCVVTYNQILFGKDAPSHHQLGYVRSKWKSGQKPEHIPERVHKPKKYVKPCFFIAFLMIPVVVLHTLDDYSRLANVTKAREYYEAGRAAFAEAAQAKTAQEAVNKFAEAYFDFSLAASDYSNQDVHVYLGICYAGGLGCARNDAEAFRHLTMYRPVTNEYPDAQYQLGILYLHGRGTDQNIPEAAKLLNAAAAKGQKDARDLLGYPEPDPNSPLASDDVPDYGGMTVEEYLIRKLADTPSES